MPFACKLKYEYVPLNDIGIDRLAAFLAEAEKRHPIDDWADRYAIDAAQELGVKREEFYERVVAAANAHHNLPPAARDAPDHDWKRWYAAQMLAR